MDLDLHFVAHTVMRRRRSAVEHQEVGVPALRRRERRQDEPLPRLHALIRNAAWGQGRLQEVDRRSCSTIRLHVEVHKARLGVECTTAGVQTSAETRQHCPSRRSLWRRGSIHQRRVLPQPDGHGRNRLEYHAGVGRTLRNSRNRTSACVHALLRRSEEEVCSLGAQIGNDRRKQHDSA